MIMKNKSGMTLLEIVVALAIFAIMSVGFYGMFSTVFINMYQTSLVTENAFHSQQLLEERIADVKDKLKEGLIDEVDDDELSITLFSGGNLRTVNAFHLSETMVNGRVVETLIAENRPPQLRVPVITSEIIIKAKNGSAEIKYPNIASRDNFDIILEGGTPTVDNEGYLIQHLYYWYISKPGIYTIAQPPLFPEDFQILAGYTAKDIVTIPESFAGKFLLLMVTPVGEKGAMGTAEISNLLYISPLTVTNNLILHYDASLVDTTEVNDGEYLNNKVIKWNNTVGSDNLTNLTPSSSNLAPNIALKEYGTTPLKRTYSIMRSTASNSQTLSGSNSYTSLNSVTVYFVANFASSAGVENNIVLINSRYDSTNRNKFVLKTSSVSGREGQLEIIRYYSNTGQGTSSIVNNSNYRTNDWEIIKLEIYSSSLGIKHGVQKVEDVYSFINNVSQNINAPATMNLSRFQMNFVQGYGVGEVMVYNGIVSNEDEQKILKYLSDKYQP